MGIGLHVGVARAIVRVRRACPQSIRFTLGRITTEEKVDEVVQQVTETVSKLRALARCWI